MGRTDTVRVDVICECGQGFQVSVAGVDLELLRFTCPNCRCVDRLTAAQISDIQASQTRATRLLSNIFRGNAKDRA